MAKSDFNEESYIVVGAFHSLSCCDFFEKNCKFTFVSIICALCSLDAPFETFKAVKLEVIYLEMFNYLFTVPVWESIFKIFMYEA